MIVVTQQSVLDVLGQLLSEPILCFDTETTGLRPWQGDRLFSLAIASPTQEFYFNFQNYQDLNKAFLLDKTLLSILQSELFSDPSKLWIAHNLKFDLAMLAVESVEVKGQLYCTEAQARLVNNDLFSYSLETLTKNSIEAKDTSVKDFLKKEKTKKEATYNGVSESVPDFTKLPFEMLSKYACQDTRATFSLYLTQQEKFAQIESQIIQHLPRLNAVSDLEKKITRTFFNMERRGAFVDLEYSFEAANIEDARIEQIKRQWQQATGSAFIDSAKSLAPAFDKIGELYPKTEKGNPSFTAEVLENMSSPLAKLIMQFRDAQKRANTYFRNFINYADSGGYIHPNMRQSGTKTGRISYANPNLQNLSKSAEKSKKTDMPVRGAFATPSQDFQLCAIDFSQCEYRLMADYAREMPLIEKIKSGFDVHEATASMMSTPRKVVSRDEAKTINFMLLYGGGVVKLTQALFASRLPEDELKALYKVKFWRNPRLTSNEKERFERIPSHLIESECAFLAQAQELKALYFDKLPAVKSFIELVKSTAETRGYIVNWLGRVYRFAGGMNAHNAPNFLIQGGCADMMKIAMPEIETLLERTKSTMRLQIHDELLFYLHNDEHYLVPKVKAILETAYPSQLLPMICDVSFSKTHWGSMQKAATI